MVVIFTFFIRYITKPIVCALFFNLITFSYASLVPSTLTTFSTLQFLDGDKKIEVSPEFIGLCEAIMEANPLDNHNLPLSPRSSKSVPLTTMSLTHNNKYQYVHDYLRHFIGGRNIVLTKQDSRPVMVITGLGPTINSFDKMLFEQKTGINIVDIVDALPIFPDEKLALRDTMYYSREAQNLYRRITKIPKSLPTKLGVLFSKIKLITSYLNLYADKFCNTTFNAAILDLKNVFESIYETAKLKKISNGDTLDPQSEQQLNKSIAEFKSKKHTINSELKEKIRPYFDGLSQLVQYTYSPLSDEVAVANLGVNSMLQANTIELLYSMNMPALHKTSILGLERNVLFPHTTTLPYENQNEVMKELGYMVHSEPIYCLWRQHQPIVPVRYFFSQRDMCCKCQKVISFIEGPNRDKMIIFSAKKVHKKHGNPHTSVDFVLTSDNVGETSPPLTKQKSWSMRSPNTDDCYTISNITQHDMPPIDLVLSSVLIPTQKIVRIRIPCLDLDKDEFNLGKNEVKLDQFPRIMRFKEKIV